MLYILLGVSFGCRGLWCGCWLDVGFGMGNVVWEGFLGACLGCVSCWCKSVWSR